MSANEQFSADIYGNIIKEQPSFSGKTVLLSENDKTSNAPRSPTQTIRSSSAFSKQLQFLRAQSEGIHEECEDFISSSTCSSTNTTVDKSSNNSCGVKLAQKSKEAEDAISRTSISNKRLRTSSMSDNENQRIGGILKNSPHISKEDISASNEVPQKNVSFDKRPSIKSRFLTNPAPVDQTEPGNVDAINKYYEKNQYTVTGIYQKNNPFSKIHQYVTGNNEEDEFDGEKIENGDERKPKRTMSMAQSTKSIPIIPVNNRFHQSFYWLAHNHKKIGLRHLCMLLLVTIYTIMGAAIFYSIESQHEISTMKIHKLKLEKIIFEIAQTLEIEILDPEKLTNITQMEYFITKAYIKLLNAEDLYSGSTFYKHEDPKNLKWTYGSALFFSMNVYTTTGYGSIAPASTLGKAVVIIYGLIFVPLTAVVIRDLGQWALLYLTKMYTIITDSFRRAQGFIEKFDEDEMITLPIKFSVSVMILYLMSATVFIYKYDDLSGEAGSGISFFHAFYFSFISMSTIGLGDIMPNNVTFSPLITILFFFGMPILKVVNRVTYICLENGVFGSMTVLENRLDQAWNTASVIPTKPDISVPEVAQKQSVASAGMIVEENDGTVPNEYLNNFTIRSIATFMRANGDVYGGGFGRVNMRRGDLRNLANYDNQATIRSRIARDLGPQNV